jgi:tetratricopeptide (TPR) repeat protein
VKSLFQLKSKLSKDYITWMTSEYKGFRVLPSTVKKWFDHEIAPNRTEIFTPPHYQQFALSTADFKKMAEQTEKRLSDLEKASEEDLWAGSIFNYQQGNNKRAIELLNALLRKNPEHAFAYFNLGQICIKDMRKQEAINAFAEFTRRKTQSWWTTLARDLMRQLQMG